VFNRNLREYLKAYNNTQIVEVASNRDYFTRHGLHLNRKGKDSIAQKIAAAIQDQLNTQKCAPTVLSPNINDVRCEDLIDLRPDSPTGDAIKRSVVGIMEVMNSSVDGEKHEQTRNSNSTSTDPGVLCRQELVGVSQVNSSDRMLSDERKEERKRRRS
jgi:hypothetical protein